MHAMAQAKVWDEVQRSFSYFRAAEPKPQIILIPELSVPRGRILDLQRAARALGAVVIAGVDYRLDSAAHHVWNEAVLLIPEKWKKGERSRRLTSITIGKTYAAMEEDAELAKKENGGWTFVRQPHCWLFDVGEAGRFGVSICYDFLDLQRALLYKELIQHLFVISYNRDTDSFLHNAESLARTMYCNVVVCNTGYHGGSLAITPYYEPWQRTVYRHNGNEMLVSQVVKLPVRAMINAQAGKADPKTFKSLPPGWQQSPGGKSKLESKTEAV
jgi:predicted amidohydrolase